jgi:hypothetical protein
MANTFLHISKSPQYLLNKQLGNKKQRYYARGVDQE